MKPVGEQRGDATQHGISGGVAEPVVESLEMVDIEHHQCRRVPRFLEDQMAFRQSIVEGATVGDLGQGIGTSSFRVAVQLVRLMLQAIFGRSQFALHILVAGEQVLHDHQYVLGQTALRGRQPVVDDLHPFLVLAEIRGDIFGDGVEPLQNATGEQRLAPFPLARSDAAPKPPSDEAAGK